MKTLKIKLTMAFTFLFGVALVSQNEVEFRTDGIVVPRLSSAAVMNPVKGQLVFDTIFGEVMCFDGVSWQQFSSGGGSGSGSDFSDGGEFAGSTRSLGNKDEFDFRIITDNIDRIYIKSDGKVGIGNGTPSQELDVLGNIRVSDTVFTESISTLGTSASLEFLIDKDPKMILDNLGYFGLGTTNPSSELHLSHISPNILLESTSETSSSSISFERSVGGIGTQFARIGDTELGNDLELKVNGTDDLNIVTNGKLRAKFDDSGHLHLGDVIDNLNVNVNGALKYVDGNQGTNKVLTSDASGNASWEEVNYGFNEIEDPDGDTKIQLEESTDEDKIRFDTKGVQRMMIDDEGQIGIGPGDPAANLHVSSAIGDHPLLISGPGGAKFMTIPDGGNVGINEPNPDARLHVNGQVKIVDGTQGIGKVLTSDLLGRASWATPPSQVIMDEINDDDDDTSVSITNSDDIHFSSDGDLRMQILDNGIVGIGTFDSGIFPMTDLHMYDHSTTDIVMRMQSSQNNATSAKIEMGGTNAMDDFEEYADISANNAFFRFDVGSGIAYEFMHDGDEIMRLTTDGKLGINDDNPDALIEASADSGTDDYLMLSSEDHLDGDVFIINSGGDVGIGDNSPDARLDLEGLTEAKSSIVLNNTGTGVNHSSVIFESNHFEMAKIRMHTDDSDNGSLRFFTSENKVANTNMTITHDGDVGIGTIIPQDVLDVNGDIRVGTAAANGCIKSNNGGTITGSCSSDQRLKKNIRPLGTALGKVTELEPVKYEWRGEEFPERGYGEGTEWGLIAQNVKEVFPEMVSKDEEGYYKVAYHKLQFVMLQSIKELKEENDQLREELSLLVEALVNNKLQYNDKVITEDVINSLKDE